MIPPKSASIAVKQAFFVGGRLTSASLLSRVAITVYIVDSKNLELMIYQVDIRHRLLHCSSWQAS